MDMVKNLQPVDKCELDRLQRNDVDRFWSVEKSKELIKEQLDNGLIELFTILKDACERRDYVLSGIQKN